MLLWLSLVCVIPYLCVVCLTVLANCLLNAFDVCVGEVVVFYWKFLCYFFWLSCFLLANP